MRIAQRALERKKKRDSGDTVVVGENYFVSPQGKSVDYGEVFEADPVSEARIRSKLSALREKRDQLRTDRALDALEAAARSADINLIPHLIECCHAYATVGEMVARLKRCWGEFREPVGL